MGMARGVDNFILQPTNKVGNADLKVLWRRRKITVFRFC